MDVEVVEDKENPLLKRREVRIKVSYEGATPSRQEVRGKVAALLSSDKELTILDKLEPEYGKQMAAGYVKVYADREALRVEPQYVIDRNTKVEEKKGEQPAEAGEAESKPEEKEEKPAEVKPAEKKESGGKEEKPAEKPEGE